MASIIDKIFGGGGGDKDALMKGLTETLQSGGESVTGILDKFDAAGLGDKAKSWVGGDQQKQAVTGDEVQRALGDNEINEIAQKANLPPDKAKEGLAAILPDTVSNLTPGGKIPDTNEMQEMLKKIPGV
jgi:uncharacterized protein YidB (DUF937 family)